MAVRRAGKRLNCSGHRVGGVTPPRDLGFQGLRSRNLLPISSDTSRMSAIATLGTTLASGLVAAGIAITTDNWRGDRTRRREGEIALREFQRVLADMSGYLLMSDSVIDETPLERLDWPDLAQARRAAYPYRNLLHQDDRELVTRSSVRYDAYSDIPYDSRQPEVNQWAMELDDAIDRAFAPRLRRLWIRLTRRQKRAEG